MNERIREVRKALNLTQQELADKLSLKRNTIATYEMGKAIPSDRTISDICREYNVSEEWLRSGTGEMFVPLKRNQVITDFSGDLIREDDTFRKRLIEALAKLDEKDWLVLEKLAQDLTKEKD